MSRRRAVVSISPVQYGTETRVSIGDGPAKIVSSGTGWVQKARPGNISVTSWEGMPLVAQEVPILIDRFDEQESVEMEVFALRNMAGIGRTNFDGLAPTAVRIRGPIHFSRKNWVITDIDEGEVIRLPKSRGGDITRYPATLKLLEFITPDQIRLQRRRQQQTKTIPLFYIAQKGDTLVKIAQKVYGDKSKWKMIGKAQKRPIMNPRRELKPGTKIKCPGAGVEIGLGKGVNIGVGLTGKGFE